MSEQNARGGGGGCLPLPPPELEPPLLNLKGGDWFGALKLAEVTYPRKESSCRKDNELCRVSSGRTPGVAVWLSEGRGRTQSVSQSVSQSVTAECYLLDSPASTGFGISFKLGADDDPEMTAVEKSCAVDEPFAASSLRNLR